jgi:glucose-6-phosphate 1-dehydrogenase
MPEPTQILIFGASGDLTSRKLIPALLALARKGLPAEGFEVVGVARHRWSDDAFRAHLLASLDPAEAQSFGLLAPRLHYVPGDVSRPEDLAALDARLAALPSASGPSPRRLFYLSLKPDLFLPAVENLMAASLLRRSEEGRGRVIVEKPFGHDLASAHAINDRLHELLSERQIYRIDHYLGKETVQNLFALRFNNAIFEALWNRVHVELVQITVAEELGVGQGRAGYYDRAGALRDMLQNHMLQILALVAMEPPGSLHPEAVRDQKVTVLRNLRIALPAVRARYGAGPAGGPYLEEEGVAPGSTTETFVALRAEVNTWRWAGVPFLLRHGKRMPRRFSEIKVQFRVPPIQLFDRVDAELPRSLDGEVCTLRPNVLTLSLQPREALSLSFGVKAPGVGMTMAPAHFGFDYRDRFGAATTPAYERLLLDAMQGDPTLFLRADEVEAAWRFADRVRETWNLDLLEYAAGSWGPPEADRLFQGCEGAWSRG